MFCDWLRRFLIQKKLRCDVPVILRLLGNIYLASIHNSWLTDSWVLGIYWLRRDMAASLFICSLFSVPENTSGPHRRPGGHILYLGAMSVLYSVTLFFFFPKEGSEPLSQCQAPQNPGLALPRVQVNKRRRALAFIPHLLRKHCWTSRHWRRPGATGLCSTPSQQLVSSKCQVATVKGQETSSVGEDVG